MLLDGFGFSGYRSFGDELTKIAPLKKINFVIGRNNIGKSNIVNFLSNQYKNALSQIKQQANSGYKLNEIDKHISTNKTAYRIAFPVLSCDVDEYIESKFNDKLNYKTQIFSAKKLLNDSAFTDGYGNIWFAYKSTNHNGKFDIDIDINAIKNILTNSEWYSLWNALTRTTGGDLTNHWIPDSINKLCKIPNSCPKIEVIPAIRKIESGSSEATDFSGKGIIERLAKIQNPPLPKQKDKMKFDAINTFVQEVLENKSAMIEIPYDRDMILVHMDNKTLPLESLGTGIHEVIILAAAATLLEETILCVEEPELHLHPILQRKLINYLSITTNNQYIFTTHSAHLLDSVDSEIFHVTQSNGASIVNSISSTRERANICNDLGYKASDILQSNCIVWVEGPSDRIYLNYWISAKDPTLIEGVHYSIMFYGGRLSSHLTANDPEEVSDKIADFISLRKLNRNSAIMFDSDKSGPHVKINDTKKRLKEEFDKGPGFAWITKGREVENYLDNDQIEKSVISIHPSCKMIMQKGQWVNLLHYKKNNAIITANKVKVAKHYIDTFDVDFSKLDLDKMITTLCKFISESNSK